MRKSTIKSQKFERVRNRIVSCTNCGGEIALIKDGLLSPKGVYHTVFDFDCLNGCVCKNRCKN